MEVRCRFPSKAAVNNNPNDRGGRKAQPAARTANKNMNRELIINVNPTEIAIALCEDKVLVELNKEQCQTGFAVGDIYLGLSLIHI